MGIVSTIVLLAAVAGLIYGYVQARYAADEIGPWPARGLGFLIVIALVFLVDAFVVKIPSPFAPAEVAVPNRSPEPLPAPPLKLETPKSEAPSAREQHEKTLKEWSASKP